MTIKLINQSIIKSLMWGPHQSPFILHELIPITPLFWNYKIESLLISKPSKNRENVKIARHEEKW